MKLYNKCGWWFCEFTDHYGQKQETMHTSQLTALQMAFINKTQEFPR